MSGIPADLREQMRCEIQDLESKHDGISWSAAIRAELFGDWDNLEGDKVATGSRRFACIYTNTLRTQWIKSLYEKEIAV